MFAHNPQKKGAKRWNQYRPKKTRPSDINRRPPARHTNALEFFNAPPEYLSVPDEEGCSLLQQHPLQQVLELLQQLPLQYQRATSFFLPGPVQCSLSPPRVVASRASALAAAAAAVNPTEASEAAAAASPLEKEKAAAYAQALRGEAEVAAATARERAESFHPQPTIAAASAPQTRAAQGLQEMAGDPAVHSALQRVIELAKEKEDVVLQKLGEHMQIALMPVVLPTAEDFVAGTGGAAGPSAAESAGFEDSAQSNHFSSILQDGNSRRTALMAAKTTADKPAKELRQLIASREGLNPILRASKLSPLSRFNPLLLVESLDRAWQAVQLKRFHVIVKQLSGHLRALARRLEARGVPAAALLEPGVLEMYGAFRTLPKTNFVEVYQYLHSKPWVTPVEREVAELQSKVDNSGVDASPELLVDLRSARRRLRWFAFKRLQELGLVTGSGELDIMQLRSIQEALVQQREPLSFEEHQRLQLRKRLQPRYRIVRLLDKLAFQARATAAGVRLPVLGTKRDRKASAAAVLEARRAHIPAEGDALATPSLVRIGGQQWCGPETVAVSEGEKASEGITAQKAVYGRVETSRDENAPRNDGSLCQYQMNAIQPHLVGRLSSKQLQKHSALLELAAEATGVFDVLSRADYPQYQPVQDTAKLEEYVEAEYRRHSLMSAVREDFEKWLREGMPLEKKPVDTSTRFIEQWYSLPKKRRRALMMEEMRLQAQGRVSNQKIPSLRRRQSRSVNAASVFMALRAKYNAGLLDLQSHQNKRET